ncbi:MAG: gamma-glutamyl-gamma-aminobutyrate hydrolase family protein [Ardenticatenaceae bacterium]
MTCRPIIGLPTQTLEEVPGELPRCWIMSQGYVKTLASVGGVPYMMPLLEDLHTLRALYETLDGIFLCGGVDVAPENYGHTPHSLCGRVDQARDRTELQLVKWAILDKKPVFGVCRGIQVINVASGGTLYQDIAFEVDKAIKHDYFPMQGPYSRDLLTHSVFVDTESRLGDMLGVRSIKVNSMHHQAIAEIGHGLMPTAWAPDGIIEAIESQNGHYLIGVQWHPEELASSDPRMCRLFDQFIHESRTYREKRVS